MEIPLYQIDAFTAKRFEGNPAAVCPLETWLPDSMMQSIATENNLSETAFFISDEAGFHIRWFTPGGEVDLCGHATLAAAHVLYRILDYDAERIEFDSRSGMLTVTQDSDWLTMDFPAQPPSPCAMPKKIKSAFRPAPLECLKSEDYILVFDKESDVALAQPDQARLAALDLRGVAITARSKEWDFVARFFAPKYGIPEDPVTGSAYTQLAPYWAEKTGLKRFRVKQVSQRGGELICETSGERVLISGKAVTYLQGTIQV